jgi:hypothetical protein
MSRRRLLSIAIGATGAMVLSRFPLPRPAYAASMAGPKPIPGGITMPFAPGTFHVFLPEPGKEPSTITDFDGVVGLSVIRGTCTRTRAGGQPQQFVFENDLRFMQGTYVGADGKTATGTFGFV